MTALAPCLAAMEIAVVMPRSLNDAGRVDALDLDQHLAPVSSERCSARDERRAALAEGDDRRAGRARQAVAAYSPMTPRHGLRHVRRPPPA